MNPGFSSLWAKKSKIDFSWLPLWLHLEDTVAITKQLWKLWISDGVKGLIARLCNATEEEALQLLLFLAASHDIGKATPVFQAKTSQFHDTELDQQILRRIRKASLPMYEKAFYTNGRVSPHGLAGFMILDRQRVNRNIAAVVSGHHGKPSDFRDLDYSIGAFEENYYSDATGKSEWIKVQDEYLAFALAKAEISDPGQLAIPNKEAQILLTAILVVADWIASNEKLFPYLSADSIGETVDLGKRASDGWHQVKFPALWAPVLSMYDSGVFQERFGGNGVMTPNSLQEKVIELANEVNQPGLMIIESTMGSGKTEAALAAAEIFAIKTNRSGLFFALPTQATSNSMFSRVIEWIDRLDGYNHTVKLAHGKARNHDLLNEIPIIDFSSNIYENDEATNHLTVVHEWFEGQKKTLLADFVIGTVDQVLLAALKQKHVMLRHLGLSNKIVIIDECHAYDAYMNQYLYKALSWLAAYNVPVIILSATLPKKKKHSLILAYQKGTGATQPRWDAPVTMSYPLLTATDGGVIREVSVDQLTEEKTIHIQRISDNLIIPTIREYLEGGVIGIILNTVSRAQKFYQLLSEEFGNDSVDLIHSRFTAYQRSGKETRILNELGRHSNSRPKFRILIGTQILEQSLDIDFDLLISDLCPMDLLLQRIGRLHRHRRTRPPKLADPVCYVVSPEGIDLDNGSVLIYSEHLLRRTEFFLKETIAIPSDIAILVEAVYDEMTIKLSEDHDWNHFYEIWKHQMDDRKVRAKAFQISDPMTRKDQPYFDWLNTSQPDSEQSGKAAVRDGSETIEVLLIIRDPNGTLRTLPGVEPQVILTSTDLPDRDESLRMAKQTVSLPRQLCYPWVIDATILELEKQTLTLPFYSEVPLFRGELFLVLDHTLSAAISNQLVRYDLSLGLLYEEDQMNDKTGI